MDDSEIAATVLGSTGSDAVAAFAIVVGLLALAILVQAMVRLRDRRSTRAPEVAPPVAPALHAPCEEETRRAA